MEKLVSYLDQVKAEQELKQKTANFVGQALQSGLESDTKRKSQERGKGRLAMNKITAALASVAACAVLLIGGWTFYNQPQSYVSFDINPSVELGINAFNRVVSAEGMNADGQALLQHSRLRNMSVEDCLQALVQEAAQQGYVKGDGSTVIALTALADNNQDGIRLQDRARTQVQDMLQERDMDAIVYADCSSLQLRTQAREQNISSGKYRLISLLQSLDPSITVDQYRNARITDIIAKADELLQESAAKGLQNQENERTRAMIMETAQKIQQANQVQNQNRQQNQSQSQDQTGAEQQARNQNQNMSQNQNQNAAVGQQVQVLNQYQNQNQTGTQSGGEQQNQVENQYQNQNQTGTQSGSGQENSPDQNQSQTSTGEQGTSGNQGGNKN